MAKNPRRLRIEDGRGGGDRGRPRRRTVVGPGSRAPRSRMGRRRDQDEHEQPAEAAGRPGLPRGATCAHEPLGCASRGSQAVQCPSGRRPRIAARSGQDLFSHAGTGAAAGRDLLARRGKVDVDRADDGPGAEPRTRTRSREVDRLVDVVGDVDDRDGGPRGRVDAQQKVLELGAGQRVDRRERLVQEQDSGARRARGRSPPAAASRPRAATDTCARRPRGPTPRGRLGARDLAGLRQPDVAKGNVTLPDHGQPREERAAVVLEDEREFARGAGDGSAVEEDRALARRRQAAEQAKQSRLAAPDAPTMASSSPSSTSK